MQRLPRSVRELTSGTAVFGLLIAFASVSHAAGPIHVTVVGDVPSPGVYRLDSGSPLSKVLSAAGCSDDSMHPRLVRGNSTSYVEDSAVGLQDLDVLLVDPVGDESTISVVLLPRNERPILADVPRSHSDFETVARALGLGGASELFVATGPVLERMDVPIRQGDVLVTPPLSQELVSRLTAGSPVVADLSTQPPPRLATQPSQGALIDLRTAAIAGPSVDIPSKENAAPADGSIQEVSLSLDTPVAELAETPMTPEPPTSPAAAITPFVGSVPTLPLIDSVFPKMAAAELPAPTTEPTVEPVLNAVDLAAKAKLEAAAANTPAALVPEAGGATVSATVGATGVSAAPVSAKAVDVPTFDLGGSRPADGERVPVAAVANQPLTLPNMPGAIPTSLAKTSSATAASDTSSLLATPSVVPAGTVAGPPSSGAVVSNPSTSMAIATPGAGASEAHGADAESSRTPSFDDFAMIAAQQLSEEQPDEKTGLTRYLGLGLALLLVLGGVGVLASHWLRKRSVEEEQPVERTLRLVEPPQPYPSEEDRLPHDLEDEAEADGPGEDLEIAPPQVERKPKPVAASPSRPRTAASTPRGSQTRRSQAPRPAAPPAAPLAGILRMPAIDDSDTPQLPARLAGEPIGGKRLRIDAAHDGPSSGPHFGRRNAESSEQTDDVLARALLIMKQENLRRAA